VDKALTELRQQKGEAPRVVDGRKWIGERRLVKSPAEIEAMRRACEVTIEAHLAAIRAARPGMNEGEVEAAAEFAFRALGGPRLGYPSICGGGNNGCVLHYNSNDEVLGPNALMLMDAATEVGFYTADVTRTWPVNGKFTPEQRALYDIVLKAQNAGIDKCRDGVPVGEVHDAAVAEVVKGLIDVKILQGDAAELVQKGAHRKFFMHGTSHWLGLDVHDAGDYQAKKRPLRPGMVLTVEPGIYIAEGTEGVDKRWWGIGIRIEDDILVTAGAPENLTARLPRDPDLLESLVRGEK
jgi:Xaa-Pro aminopeptidase